MKIRTDLQFHPTETVLGLGDAALVRLHQGSATLAAGEAWLYRHGVLPRALVKGDPIPEFALAR